MSRQWRQVLPPLGFTFFLFVCYMLTYLVDLFFYSLGLLVPKEIGVFRLPILLFAAALFGYYRVRVFHPAYNKKYREWLCLIPWSIDKPLPQGPVHLVWMDFVILAILTFLTYSNVSSKFLWPLITFLIVYLFLNVLAFDAELIVFTVLSLFIFPFAFYPFKNDYITVVVLFLLYGLCYVGFKKSLKDFPWNTKYWKADIVEEFKKQAIKNRIIGWPFRNLDINKAYGISFWDSLTLSLLLTWWLHVFHSFSDEPYKLAPLSILSFYTASVRIIFYVIKYHPPISLFGRFATGRIIVPRYDKIFIAPICILLAGMLLPYALSYFDIDELWIFEICFFLIFFLAFSLPPKMNTWKFTGSYRISKLVQIAQPRPINPRDRAFYDFFAAKFKDPK